MRFKYISVVIFDNSLFLLIDNKAYLIADVQNRDIDSLLEDLKKNYIKGNKIYLKKFKKDYILVIKEMFIFKETEKGLYELNLPKGGWGKDFLDALQNSLDIDFSEYLNSMKNTILIGFLDMYGL